MEANKSIYDYVNYSLEEFLQDDYFIASMVDPDKDSERFWAQYQKLIPNEDFILAVKHLRDIRIDQPEVSVLKKEAIWTNIRAEVLDVPIPKPLNKRKSLSTWLVAAILCGIIGVTFLFWTIQNSAEDKTGSLERYVEQFDSQSNDLYSDLKNVAIFNGDTLVRQLDGVKPIVNASQFAAKSTGSKVIYRMLKTPAAKQSILYLEDGTKVWVNANTTIIFPNRFDTKSREIYVDGEAYLEVFHDTKRPFSVKTQNDEVKVLGTKFDVRAFKGTAKLKVVLVSGKVSVEGKNSLVYLYPNEMIEKSDGQETKLPVNAMEHITWSKGYLDFNKDNLEKITSALSDYYNVKIECADKVKKIAFSGKILLSEDIKDVLEGLCFSAHLSYRRDKNKIYLSIK